MARRPWQDPENEDDALDEVDDEPVGAPTWGRPKPPRPKPPIQPPKPPVETGGAWRKAQNGRSYVISGVQVGAFTWTGVKGVTLTGPATIDARNKKAYTAFLNGCENLVFRRIRFVGGQLGVFVQRGTGFLFEDCEFSDNDQSCLLTNYPSNLTLRRCKGNRARREHICYISDGTDGVLIEDSTFGNCGRMPIQVNGSDSGFVKNVRIVRCDLGPGGYGVSISVYGADGVAIEDCRLRDNVGVRTATKCPRNVTVARCRFDGNVRVEGKDGCQPPRLIS